MWLKLIWLKPSFEGCSRLVAVVRLTPLKRQLSLHCSFLIRRPFNVGISCTACPVATNLDSSGS